jgi:hypothetical protein
LGHSGSQAPQLMHSSVILYAIGFLLKKISNHYIFFRAIYKPRCYF